MRQPLAIDVVTATAEKYVVCVRPFMMEVGDLDTGELRHDGTPVDESTCDYRRAARDAVHFASLVIGGGRTSAGVLVGMLSTSRLWSRGSGWPRTRISDPRFDSA
jgi:hypothetical protein